MGLHLGGVWRIVTDLFGYSTHNSNQLLYEKGVCRVRLRLKRTSRGKTAKPPTFHYKQRLRARCSSFRLYSRQTR